MKGHAVNDSSSTQYNLPTEFCDISTASVPSRVAVINRATNIRSEWERCNTELRCTHSKRPQRQHSRYAP